MKDKPIYVAFASPKLVKYFKKLNKKEKHIYKF